MADLDAKASLSNKSEQKLRSLNSYVGWLARATRGPLFEALYYRHVEPYLLSWEETLGFFAGSTVRLYSGPKLHVSLVSYSLCWDATNGPGLPVHNNLAFFAD